MTGDGPSGPLWVRQRVTSFPDPASAAAYMAAAQAHWGYCTGNVGVVTRHGAATVVARTSGDVSIDLIEIHPWFVETLGVGG